MDGNTVGKWAFIIGILLGVVMAFTGDFGGIGTYILLILAIVGGWFRVSKESTNGFLILALALGVTSGALDGLHPVLGQVMGGVNAFVAPAALTVVVREVVGWFMPSM